MSKQRRKPWKRIKRSHQRRSFVRNGVEQLESRVFPGGFLDLLAGAAMAATFDLLPAEELVPEEIDSESITVTVGAPASKALLRTDFSLPQRDVELPQARFEVTTSNEDLELASQPQSASAVALASSLVDPFFSGNQFVTPAASHPPNATPRPTMPARSFSSPISQLGAGVGSGAGQGYNMTGAEVPQRIATSAPAAVSSTPGWTLGEGEGGSSSSGSGTSSAPGSVAAASPVVASASASGCGSGMMTASGTISIDVASAVSEAAGVVKFPLVFHGSAPCGFTVDWGTTPGGSATAGDDYTATTGSTAFSGTHGETKEIQIGILNDSIVEPDEDFYVKLNNVHDGAGNPVPGNIAIGQGGGSASGSGSGGTGGGGSTYGSRGRALILYDDYDLYWRVSSPIATEGGAPAELTFKVNPSPRHFFDVHYQIAPNNPIPGASGADFQATSGVVNVYPQEDKTNDPYVEFKGELLANDDTIIEETEWFDVINVSTVFGSGGAPDSVHLHHPTFAQVKVVDNEWRWVDPAQVLYDQTRTADFNDGMYDWTPWHQDTMTARMKIEAVTDINYPLPVATGLRIDLIAASDRLTANSLMFASREFLSLHPIYEKFYSCDPSDGEISPLVDPVTGVEPLGYSGTGHKNGILSTYLKIDETVIDNEPATEHTVKFHRILGGAAVGGGLERGIGLIWPISLVYNGTEPWGTETPTMGVETVTLTCKKGS